MILCIDTISQAAGITLITDNKSVYSPLDPYRASEGILREIDKLLNENGATVADLRAIFVIKGPGSFTGLRVGLTVANQFAHQLKIPILGLRTDEWWLARADEPEPVYLQTMNREEVYVACDQKSEIVPLGELHNTIKLTCPLLSKEGGGGGPTPENATMGLIKWLGQLSDDHRQKLPEAFHEIKELKSIEEAWQTAVKSNSSQLKAQSSIIEPFYGKEPMITKSTKKLGL